MNLKLTIYTDETMSEVSRIAEADELVIPYKVSMWLLENLDSIKTPKNFNSEDSVALMKFIGANIDKVEKILKATFKVSNTELEFVNSMEILNTMKELYQWAMSKVDSLGGKEKNA